MRIILIISIVIFTLSYSKAQNVICSVYGTSENSQSVLGEPVTNLLGSDYQISLGFLQGEWEIIRSGISTIELDNDNWKVSPTLFNDYIFIRNNNIRVNRCKVEIFSLNGNLKFYKNIESDYSTLEVKSLPRGYYILRIINDSKVVYGIKLLK